MSDAIQRELTLHASWRFALGWIGPCVLLVLPAVVAAAPCDGVSCPIDQYCSGGQCHRPCAPCDAGHRCVAGECLVDPCAAVSCGVTEVCSRVSVTCVPNLCVGLVPDCRLGRTCDPVTGNCVDDPCAVVKCPSGAVCRGGECMYLPPDLGVANVDLGVATRGLTFQSGSGGCVVGTGPSADVVLCLLLALALVVNRRCATPM